ncbi:hypothetical protein AX16_003296 [Volvariella volvacea WC 439]|nr:hypothetical protein AX16_003296 [Volvariella volvacea WC 439]
MTRTSRASFPRAIIKDRSESKSGLDKSVRKNGAGGHNWGSLQNERELEDAALYDEEYEEEEEEEESTTDSTASLPSEKKGNTETPNGSPTLQEVEDARKLRKGALKRQDVDLAAIARTSAAVSTSPPPKIPVGVANDTTM